MNDQRVLQQLAANGALGLSPQQQPPPVHPFSILSLIAQVAATISPAAGTLMTPRQRAEMAVKIIAEASIQTDKNAIFAECQRIQKESV